MRLPLLRALRGTDRADVEPSQPASARATKAPLIVGIGDSILWGSGTSDPPDTSFIGRAAALAGTGYVNLGIPAAFTDRIAMEIPRVRCDDAWVVLNAGTNNVGVACRDASVDAAVAAVRTETSQAHELLAACRARLPGAGIVIVTVRDIGRAGGAYPNAAPDALTAAAHVWNGHLRMLAAQYGAKLLDLENDAQWYIRSEYDNTGLHPNDAGSARLGRALAALIA